MITCPIELTEAELHVISVVLSQCKETDEVKSLIFERGKMYDIKPDTNPIMDTYQHIMTVWEKWSREWHEDD